MKQAIILTTFLGLLAYATGVFINADFNMVEWSKDSRNAIGGCYSFIIIFTLAMYAISLDNKKEIK